MKKILNLTQHVATPEQSTQGVIEPSDKKRVQELITFNSAPSRKEMLDRATEIVTLAKNEGYNTVLIGGAVFFQYFLHKVLELNGITPVYSFSERVSIEETLSDGSVKKSCIFKHTGFVGIE